MSKKNIEKYIPTALEKIDNFFIKELKKLYPKLKEKSIPSEYNGYISSFGASMLQSGLKPTLALFENENSKTQKAKKLLPQTILQILDSKTSETSLLRYVINSNKQETLLKKQILDISIAIKLSIRTFKLDKGKDNEQ